MACRPARRLEYAGMAENPYEAQGQAAARGWGGRWKWLLWLFCKLFFLSLLLLWLLRWINPFGAFDANGPATFAKGVAATAILGVYAVSALCFVGCLISLIGWRITGYSD